MAEEYDAAKCRAQVAVIIEQIQTAQHDIERNRHEIFGAHGGPGMKDTLRLTVQGVKELGRHQDKLNEGQKAIQNKMNAGLALLLIGAAGVIYDIITTLSLKQ
jgi:hypothetical protein